MMMMQLMASWNEEIMLELLSPAMAVIVVVVYWLEMVDTFVDKLETP
jgi:hypothetical protein